MMTMVTRETSRGRTLSPAKADQHLRRRETDLAGAPRPTRSHVTTIDGRSPGSRLFACAAFPGLWSQWRVGTGSPLTVAGAATALDCNQPAPCSLFNPRGEPSRQPYPRRQCAVNSRALPRSLLTLPRAKFDQVESSLRKPSFRGAEGGSNPSAAARRFLHRFAPLTMTAAHKVPS
jgi:hypothetical protein